MELEDAVNAMLSFQSKAAIQNYNHNHHYLDQDNDNLQETQHRSNLNNSNQSIVSSNHNRNRNRNSNHSIGSGKRRSSTRSNNDGSNHRNRRSNTYERKRALRRLQRALLSFEEVMDHIHNHNNSTINNTINSNTNSNTKENDDNDNLMMNTSSTPHTLNEWTLNLLLDILTEIPKALPSYRNHNASTVTNTHTSAANTVAATEQISSSSATVTTATAIATTTATATATATTATMMDQLYNQEIVTITCSIIQKYALLPLHESLIDRLLDQIANFVSTETTRMGRMARKRSQHSSIVREYHMRDNNHDGIDDINGNVHVNGRSDDGDDVDDDGCSLVSFCGQHQYFFNMVQIVNTSLLAQDQKLQQQVQEQQQQVQQQQQQHNKNHLQEEELQQQYCNNQNTLPITTNNEHGHDWRDNIYHCQENNPTDETHDDDNDDIEKRITTTTTTTTRKNNMSNNIRHTTYTGTGTIENDNDSNMKNSSSLLLLNANETIALTQLLIPLSLKHLSHSWDFGVTCAAINRTNAETAFAPGAAAGASVNTQNDGTYQNNVNENHYQSQQYDYQHQNLQNQQIYLGDELVDTSTTVTNTNTRMNNKSQQQMIEIDEDGNDIHLEDDDNNQNNTSMVEGNNEMNEIFQEEEEEENAYKAEKEMQQESEIQLRVLLGYLFRHLTSLMYNDGKGENDTYNDEKSCISASLEESLYQLFHDTTNTSTCHRQNQHHHSYYSYGSNNNTARERKLFVEDYIDLVTSFLIESIEYAIDVMDNASHFLRNFISNNKFLDDDMNIELGGNGKLPQQHDGLGTNDERVRGNITSIRCHVKDTIRHCSIAIGVIEIFYEDMKLHNFSTNNSSLSSTSDNSHLMSLYKSYTEFVASFCTDELLHGTFCWSSAKDVEAVSVLFDSADNVLFRLSEIVSTIENKERKNKNPFESSDGLDAALTNRGKKRRRVNYRRGAEGNIRFMDTATTVVFLRAFHCSKNRCFEGEENETGRAVIQTTMSKVHSKLQRIYPYERNDIDSCRSVVEFKAASETINLIQACALSTLMLTSCNSDDQGNIEHLNNQQEEHLLGSLLSPLMRGDHDVNAKEGNSVIDPLNPWSYLLRTKIAEMSPGVKGWNRNANVVPAPLPTAVSTSSVSSVSDLKSNIASIASSKSGEIIEGHHDTVTCVDPRSVISDFMKAVPKGFDTLEEKD